MEKLLWKTKQDTKFSRERDFLEEILASWGVTDIKGFLNPSVENINDPFLFKNMDKGIKLLHDVVEAKKNIFVKIDCDADGYTSASTIIQFIKSISPGIKIDYALNYEKRHGLTYEDVGGHESDEYGLFIIPDASMSVEDARNIKKHFSGDIIVLDHHLTEMEFYDKINNTWISSEEAKAIRETDPDRIEEDCYTNYCISINCQDGVYPNNTLSGAGVVYKFLEAYARKYGIKDDMIKKYLDLVSLGCIADSMDLRDLETRYYVLEGLKEENCHNELISEMCKLFEEDMHFGRTIHNIGWVIAPKINGVVRYGEDDEQVDLFRAICGEEEDRVYQPRRKHASDPKPDPETQSLQKWMARVSKNVKDRQDAEVRKFMSAADSYILENHLDKNSILFVDGTSIIRKKTVTGLVANKLAAKYCRPAILLKAYKDDELGGSGRNYVNGPIENLNTWLTERGVVCKGHESAFGVQLNRKDLPALIERCNKDLPLDNLKTVYTVDYEIEASSLKQEDIKAVAENYAIWGGNTTPVPVFAITNLRINAMNIKAYGENGNFIRFTYNGIPFLRKFAPHTMYDEMTCRKETDFGPSRKNVVMNIIGEFYLNEYDGKLIPQVKILQFDSFVDESKDSIQVENIIEKNMTAEKILKTIDEVGFDW